MKTIQVAVKNLCTEEVTVCTYAVNEHNEGLFVNRGEGCGWNQVTGTGQFYANSPKSLMRGLGRMYEDQIVRMVRNSADGWE